jgi:hypothetical protein
MTKSAEISVSFKRQNEQKRKNNSMLSLKILSMRRGHDSHRHFWAFRIEKMLILHTVTASSSLRLWKVIGKKSGQIPSTKSLC